MPTFAEMKTRVGRKLGIVTDTIDLSAEDGQIIGDALLDVQEQIATLANTAGLDVENGTDNQFADPLAAIVAASLVEEYGIPEPRRSQLIAAGKLGLIPPPPAYRLLVALLQAPAFKLQTTTDVTVV